MPFEEVERRAASGRRLAVNPLFPGYVFVGLVEPEASWQPINSTLGVSRLVSFGDHQPSVVPDNLIKALQARCDPSGRIRPPASLSPGDQVVIGAGPLANYVATVEKMLPQQRVWLLLDILGQRTRVAVPMCDVRSRP